MVLNKSKNIFYMRPCSLAWIGLFLFKRKTPAKMRESKASGTPKIRKIFVQERIKNRRKWKKVADRT
ncbi:hypothetical protein D4Q76_02245 [archaeon]|nr:MAG: hypothetical protein D4Q76_02245 [archaeon]